MTGGTGLLGKAITEACPHDGSVIALHLRHLQVLFPPSTTEILGDVRNREDLLRIFGSHDFDAVVHAAGLSNVDYVERYFTEAVESNLTGTANVVACCNQFQKHLIYISSNAVFDGTRAPYREGDPTCPVHAYGRIKVQCEEVVLKEAHSYSIARPILMYGWNYASSRQNPVTWLLEAMSRGNPVPVVTDVSENTLFYLQAGEAMWKLARRPDLKLVHLGGGETVNRYQFALTVARIFGLDQNLIRQVDSAFFPNLVPRPKNTSYATEIMKKELRIHPMTVEQGLLHMKKQSKE